MHDKVSACIILVLEEVKFLAFLALQRNSFMYVLPYTHLLHTRWFDSTGSYKPIIYHTPGEHASNYITYAVVQKRHKKKRIKVCP
jgi:hypothetical protein